MYRIQGSDNKEYGPIPAETIRQWVGERRLNHASLARLEAEAVWKPLAEFAEFADLFSAASPAVPPVASPVAAAPDPSVARDAALALVKTPAMLLVVLGILSAVMSVVIGGMQVAGVDPGRLIMELFKLPQQGAGGGPDAMVTRFAGIFQIVVGLPWNVVIAVGATRMMRLQSRGLATAAAVLACLPCFSCCCLVTMPVGIWALTTLSKPEVRPQFPS